MSVSVCSLMFSCPRDVGLVAVACRQLAGIGAALTHCPNIYNPLEISVKLAEFEVWAVTGGLCVKIKKQQQSKMF